MALFARADASEATGRHGGLSARMRAALDAAAVPATHAAPLRAHARVYAAPDGRRVLLVGLADGPCVFGVGADTVCCASSTEAEALLAVFVEPRARVVLAVDGTVLHVPPGGAVASDIGVESMHAAYGLVSQASSGASLGHVFVAGAPPDARTRAEYAEDVLLGDSCGFVPCDAAWQADTLLAALYHLVLSLV